MKILLSVLLLTLFITLPTKAEAIEVISLEIEFRRYWELSREVDGDKRLILWTELIETPHQDLYKSYFFGEGPKWEQARREVLSRALLKYEIQGKQMLKSFPRFERQLLTGLTNFQREFPLLREDFSIYLLPAFAFNGKAVRIGDRPALLLGVDKIVERADPFEVLFAHELFHIYHGQVQGYQDKDALTMTSPLLSEGLATYVSRKLFPEAKIYFDPDLERFDKEAIPLLAELFLEVVEVTKDSPHASELRRAWFEAESPHKVEKNMPSRLGYLLGYEVIKELSKSYSVETMARWNSKEAHFAMVLGLKRLAKRGNTNFSSF